VRLTRSAVSIALALAASALLAAPAMALPTGNLLVNPGAEAAPGNEGGVLAAPQGWIQTETIASGEQGPYDSCYGGGVEERDVLERGVGEEIEGGARFFFGGGTEVSGLTQEIAVSPAEVAGRQLLIGGDFGGFEDQEDFASLTARFFDAGNVELGSLETGRVTAAERGYLTVLLRREASAAVPSGTSRIRFTLLQVREEGSDNDGYADNLFATFDATAPPPPVATGDPACPLSRQEAAPVATPSPSVPAAPSVTITSGPPRESAQTSAPFSFTGTAGGAYECSLDGGAWKPCSSGRDFGPVAPGDHLFQVRETLGGQSSAPASYRWTVDLPKACVLRVARARVFAYTRRDQVRLVIHYTSYKAAKVTVAYALKGSKGALAIGSATARFKKAGLFRLPVKLTPVEIAAVRAAKGFTVKFKIPSTPALCGRYYTKRLTIPQKVSGQTVWFQSDSRFAPGAGA